MIRTVGSLLANVFAGGGAARGVSGPSSWGYMAGNGLLTATAFGRLAGKTAAKIIQEGLFDYLLLISELVNCSFTFLF